MNRISYWEYDEEKRRGTILFILNLFLLQKYSLPHLFRDRGFLFLFYPYHYKLINGLSFQLSLQKILSLYTDFVFSSSYLPTHSTKCRERKKEEEDLDNVTLQDPRFG